MLAENMRISAIVLMFLPVITLHVCKTQQAALGRDRVMLCDENSIDRYHRHLFDCACLICVVC
ncbi:hypothetical protein CSC3H3_08100 [Thalassospira marina]|uniref:Secreted protein n=1 Tax=Thalassospira marina TaxID=2048283 RepID=A0ABN5FCY0_9PROT|nr:hypothetical protein CSC3H3_08100 [Thalassospira marina]